MAVTARCFLGGQGSSAHFADFVPQEKKYVAFTAIYRLYTFCIHFASGFFRISDKKFLLFQNGLFPPSALPFPPWR